MKMYPIFLLAFFFFALAACKDQPNLPTPISPCELEPDPGPCEAYMPRYYYDQEEQKCKEFIWGGCGGVVPFETLEECEDCL